MRGTFLAGMIAMLVAIPTHAEPLDSTTTMQFPSTHQTDESSGWSLLIPSFVVHGIIPDVSASQQMPRKLDASGDIVATPGIGLGYVSPEGFQLFAAGLKDCYNDLAGVLQIGQSFELGHDTRWGYTVGVYARETPIVCTPIPGNVFGQTTCSSADDYSWKWMIFVNNEWVDIIPMPFLTFTTALYKSADAEVDLNFVANGVLNEFGVSFPF